MSGSSHVALMMTYASGLALTLGPLQEDGSNSEGYNFNIAVGEADETKRVFIIIHWVESSSHVTFTQNNSDLDGETLELTEQAGHSGGSTGFGIAITSVALPTSSGTVSLHVDFSGTVGGCAVYPIVVTGLNTSTFFDETSAENSVTAGDLGSTIDVPVGGFVIMGYTGSTNTGTTSVSFNGVTEQYDQGFDTGFTGTIRVAAGIQSAMQGETGRLIQVDLAGTVPDAGNAFVAQSWGN